MDEFINFIIIIFIFMSSLFSSNFTIPFPFSFKFKIIKIFGTNPMLLINKSDPVYEKIKRSG